MRPLLDAKNVDPNALQKINNFYPEIIDEVKTELTKNKIVVVGMSQNPFVIKTKNLLQSKGLEFKYLEYGSYFSKWKPRLAIKLWSGWPTFPQVFVQGQLVGGYDDLVKMINQGLLK